MDKLIIIRTDNQNNLYEQIISLITANQAKMETMSFGVFPTLFSGTGNKAAPTPGI